jgi:hypothetical protein
VDIATSFRSDEPSREKAVVQGRAWTGDSAWTRALEQGLVAVDSISLAIGETKRTYRIRREVASLSLDRPDMLPTFEEDRLGPSLG